MSKHKSAFDSSENENKRLEIFGKAPPAGPLGMIGVLAVLGYAMIPSQSCYFATFASVTMPEHLHYAVQCLS